jgi:hypothetical protein
MRYAIDVDKMLREDMAKSITDPIHMIEAYEKLNGGWFPEKLKSFFEGREKLFSRSETLEIEE